MIEEVVKYIVIVTISLILLNYLGKLFTNFKQLLCEKKDEYKFKKHAKEYIKKQKEIENNATPVKFYGLFEFKLENCDDEQNYKKEFCSIIKEKIQSKYKNIGLQLNTTDKIFFNCYNFSKFDNIIDDFIKLYNFFVDINKKRNIKTNLKFSILAKPNDLGTQKSYKLLSALNNLDFLNQVIANEEIYNQYKKQDLKMFEFQPRGIIQLSENVEDIELYRLLKSSSSKSNNE